MKEESATNKKMNKRTLFIDTGDSRELATIGEENMFSQFYYYTVGYHNAAKVLIKHTLNKTHIKSNKYTKREELRLCVNPACFLYRQYLELTLKDVYLQYSDDNDDAKGKMLNDTSHDLKKIWEYAKPLIEKAVIELEVNRDELSLIESYILEFALESPTSFEHRYPISKKLELFSSRERKINLQNLMECMDEVEAFLAGRGILAWLDVHKLRRKYEKHRSNAEKYYLENNYPLALEHYKEALIWIKKWSEKHPDIVIIYCAMAQICLKTENFDSSLCFYHQCVYLYDKVDKDIFNIPFTLDSIYNSIGLINKIQKKYDNALEYYGKPLENLAVADCDKDISYTGLARIYYNVNDRAKAEIFYEKAMNIRIKIFGDDHEHTIFLRNEINERLKS